MMRLDPAARRAWANMGKSVLADKCERWEAPMDVPVAFAVMCEEQVFSLCINEPQGGGVHCCSGVGKLAKL